MSFLTQGCLSPTTKALTEELTIKYCLVTCNCTVEDTIYLLKSGCPTVRPFCMQRPAHSGGITGRHAAEARSAESKQRQDDTERSDVSACHNGGVTQPSGAPVTFSGRGPFWPFLSLSPPPSVGPPSLDAAATPWHHYATVS